MITVILIRNITPVAKNLNKKAHSQLLALFLSAAADVVDFVEYANEEEITHEIGIHSIFGIYFFVKLNDS